MRSSRWENVLIKGKFSPQKSSPETKELNGRWLSNAVAIENYLQQILRMCVAHNFHNMLISESTALSRYLREQVKLFSASFGTQKDSLKNLRHLMQTKNDKIPEKVTQFRQNLIHLTSPFSLDSIPALVFVLTLNHCDVTKPVLMYQTLHVNWEDTWMFSVPLLTAVAQFFISFVWWHSFEFRIFWISGDLCKHCT